MPAFFQNGVLNEGNTPAAKTGTLAARQSPSTVLEGTIYISYDTQEIFTAQGGNWVKVSGTGGGGSQNIDQVLAVGNTATSKVLNFISTNFAAQYDQTRTYLNYTSGFNIHEAITQVNQNFAKLSRETILLTQNLTSQFNTESDSSAQNYLFLKQFETNNINNFRTFEVNAGYANGNSFSLTDSNITGNNLCRYEVIADALAPQIEMGLLNVSNISSNIFEKISITANRFFFIGFNGFTQELNANIPSSGSTINNLPDYSGTIGNVAERIVSNFVDLTLVSFDCDRYGIYVVVGGSLTYNFDLQNFALNGNDGECVTILAQSTIAINCVNSAGLIYGNSTILVAGLYKFVLFGGDIYSSIP